MSSLITAIASNLASLHRGDWYLFNLVVDIVVVVVVVVVFVVVVILLLGFVFIFSVRRPVLIYNYNSCI